MTIETLSTNRRRLLGGAIAAAAAGTVASPFGALGARAASNPSSIRQDPQRPPSGGSYGPLQPVQDQATGLPLLLPRGFEYISSGWTNDPMSDGTPTPGSHDGMAAYRDGDLVRLVRNHERGNGTPFSAGAVYDAASAGGTTNLVSTPTPASGWSRRPASAGRSATAPAARRRGPVGSRARRRRRSTAPARPPRSATATSSTFPPTASAMPCR